VDGPLGLIAGDGEYPLEVARAARARGQRVHAVGFHAVTPTSLDAAVDAVEWLHLGELERLLAHFRRAGVRDVVMAGKVDKRHLFGAAEAHRPDQTALALVARLKDRQDDSILDLLAEWLEGEGLTLRGQAELAPELLAPVGPMGSVEPDQARRADVAFGLPLARSIVALGVGQSVVVNTGVVVSVEAMEGTDETIRRAGRLAGPGATVIKLPRPNQDMRFDLPAIGPGTLEAMCEAGARQLVYAAGQTIVIGRSALVEGADRAGIGLLGLVSPFDDVQADANPEVRANVDAEGGT
jgi:DUF1009 family protein